MLSASTSITYKMSNVSTRSPLLTTPSVDHEANRRRWHVLRYLRACDYPATITELSEHVAPRLGETPENVAGELRDGDLPALADCGAVRYDPESQLACLERETESFAQCVRRAIAADAISHLKPPQHKLRCTGRSVES